jgi:hypothetical protein
MAEREDLKNVQGEAIAAIDLAVKSLRLLQHQIMVHGESYPIRHTREANGAISGFQETMNHLLSVQGEPEGAEVQSEKWWNDLQPYVTEVPHLGLVQRNPWRGSPGSF